MNITNHILFALDASGSMRKLREEVIDVVNRNIDNLRKSSKQLNQETRVTIFTFSDEPECKCFDCDINHLPNIENLYKIGGDTALFDCIINSVDALSSISTRYGNHSFLAYYLTDAENNINKNLSGKVEKLVSGLGEDWTLALMVPDRDAAYEAKKIGFHSGNIQIWDATSKKGVQDIGYKMNNATSSYLMARSTGMKSTRNLFTLDASKLDSKQIKRNLDELSPVDYDLLPVREDNYIKPFVETWTGKDYRVGSGYYELMKVETIQANKNICIVDKMTGRVYTGENARQLLNLPNYEIKVNPNSYGKYKIFAQSTSTNRKLIRGTQLLVLK